MVPAGNPAGPDPPAVPVAPGLGRARGPAPMVITIPPMPTPGPNRPAARGAAPQAPPTMPEVRATIAAVIRAIRAVGTSPATRAGGSGVAAGGGGGGRPGRSGPAARAIELLRGLEPRIAALALAAGTGEAAGRSPRARAAVTVEKYVVELADDGPGPAPASAWGDGEVLAEYRSNRAQPYRCPGPAVWAVARAALGVGYTISEPGGAGPHSGIGAAPPASAAKPGRRPAGGRAAAARRTSSARGNPALATARLVDPIGGGLKAAEIGVRAAILLEARAEASGGPSARSREASATTGRGRGGANAGAGGGDSLLPQHQLELALRFLTAAGVLVHARARYAPARLIGPTGRDVAGAKGRGAGAAHPSMTDLAAVWAAARSKPMVPRSGPGV